MADQFEASAGSQDGQSWYDSTTILGVTGAFTATSMWQTVAGSSALPQLGNPEGSVVSRALYDSGQHMAPSLIIALGVAWTYEALATSTADPNSRRATKGPGFAFGLTAVSAALAANGSNEIYELVTAHDVLGRPTKPEISSGDVVYGTGSVAVTLALAAVVARLRRSR